MEKQVIYRDRQELQAADLNNTQIWLDEGQQHLVADAITSDRRYTGLTVTARSSTELDVAPGRLYDGSTGRVFAIDTVQTHSVFAMLPVQDEKWLAVSVSGQEEETDIQPRDFLIDLQTRAVEPQSVAMQRRRVAVVHIAQGLESPTPEKPQPPTGNTLLAHVRLSPSGIQEVVLDSNARLSNLQQVESRVQQTEGWIASAEPRIAHIMTDIAGLGREMQARATLSQAIDLAMDVARVKERLEIPDTYIWYGADHFLDESESDTAHAGYSARVEEGIRPPAVGSATSALSLQNPLDGAARVSTSGLMLPAYDEVARLRLENRQGDIQISQYQFQTTNMVQRTLSRQRIRYGETRTACTNTGFWRQGPYDPATGIYRRAGETWLIDPAYRNNMIQQSGIVRGTRIWIDTVNTTYWEAVTVPHTVQGSTLAQTLLMAQTGWLTSVELWFGNVDPGGGLDLLICEAPLGHPDTDRVVSRQTLAASALNGGWCRIELAEPVLVRSGQRYAIVLATGAQHSVGYTSGTEYTQGVLMYRQDGQWLADQNNVERDLMLRLNFARFRSPRTEIQMNPLELTGGIADIDMLYDGVTPDGTQLVWEYQVGGMWHPIVDGTESNLSSQPSLLPLRAVMIGTTDLMPAVRLTDSQVVVSRIDTAFTHYSTARTLASASSDIRVRLLLEDFDPAVHTADCQLVIGGTPLAAASFIDEIVDGRSRWREFRFAPTNPATDYVIEITGSTSNWRQSWHVAERYDIAL